MMREKAQNDKIKLFKNFHVHYRHLYNYLLSCYKWVGGWEHISYVHLHAVTTQP